MTARLLSSSYSTVSNMALFKTTKKIQVKQDLCMHNLGIIMLVIKNMVHENGLWDLKGFQYINDLKKSISYLLFYVSNKIKVWTFM